MDRDGKDDIVTLDDSGEINILYGGERVLSEGKTEHFFTKKLLEGGLGMRLSKEVRFDGGAFSYEGLALPNQGTAPSGKTPAFDKESEAVNQGMIDNLIYYQYGYQSSSDMSSSTVSNTLDTTLSGGGFGANMKRNPDGTYAKDADGNYIDDAGSISYNAQSGSSLTGTIDYGNAIQNSILAQDIAEQIRNTQLLSGEGYSDFSALEAGGREEKRTFIRSTFAEGKGLKVEKSYTLINNVSRDTMQTDDKIRVEIALTNFSPRTFRDSVYLDMNERKLFREETDGEYILFRNGKEEKRALHYMTEGDFDYGFDLGAIAPGEAIKIRYTITAHPTAFGKITVGLLEKKES